MPDGIDAPTPYVVLDLDVVRRRYHGFRDTIPDARIFYAVKANPAAPILRALAAEGACFDVASRAELEMCLTTGATADRMSYGSTIKKERDIAYAFERGVQRFAVDSVDELAKIARGAPGAEVVVRLASNGAGSRLPLGGKFGCDPTTAARLLRAAAQSGLRPVGLSFHVGSQQLDPQAWRSGIATAGSMFADAAADGIVLSVLNLGGGFPARYDDTVPPAAAYGAAITSCLRETFGSDLPEIMIEPGRGLVAEAGTLYSEVVLVSARGDAGGNRWVYLDVGRFGGLAETAGEAIRYPIDTDRSGDATVPAALAGPTCDSEDVLYVDKPYDLPVSLRAGDVVRLRCTGAYTSSYSSIGFNGFGPLPCICVDPSELPMPSRSLTRCT